MPAEKVVYQLGQVAGLGKMLLNSGRPYRQVVSLGRVLPWLKLIFRHLTLNFHDAQPHKRLPPALARVRGSTRAGEVRPRDERQEELEVVAVAENPEPGGDSINICWVVPTRVPHLVRCHGTSV